MALSPRNAKYLEEALKNGSTSILPQNHERLLSKPKKELDTKIQEIVSRSFEERHRPRYNNHLQFSPDGLVIS